MKDYHKGLILILLAVLASTAAFFEEDRRWEMAYINHQPTAPNRDAVIQVDEDIEQLQQDIIAGLDPTLTAQPTAAGKVLKQKTLGQTIPIKEPIGYCVTGKISRSNNHSLYHDDKYMAIKQDQNTYIYLTKRDIYLLKKPLDAQSASLLIHSPDNIVEKVAMAQQSAHCKKVDLYLARIRLNQ